ncbi:hypothetical protein BKA62DRAFT_682234 [Auriculariales sp. MPI-PUGE-AT-0066]|nr:hypothetical protein BKA62DRAFT_682234 [Auriculariales sp. MPI-PUGE-AT-0066]
MSSPSPYIPSLSMSGENSPLHGPVLMTSRWHPAGAAAQSPHHPAGAFGYGAPAPAPPLPPPPVGYAPAGHPSPYERDPYAPGGYAVSGVPAYAHDLRREYPEYAGYGGLHGAPAAYGHNAPPPLPAHYGLPLGGHGYGSDEPPPLAPAPGGPVIPPPPSGYGGHPGAGYPGYPAHPGHGHPGHPGAYPPLPPAPVYGAPDPYRHPYGDPYGADPYRDRDSYGDRDPYAAYHHPDYPVLSREQVQIQRLDLQLHPYLRMRGQSQAPLPESEQGYIRWDMRYPVRNASFSIDSISRQWTRSRYAPATWPPTTDITIISPMFPWTVDVHHPDGVTVGLLMDTLDAELHRRVSSFEMPAEKELARRLATAYHKNRDELRGFLMEGMLRVDFLGERTDFAGLIQDPNLLRDRMNVPHLPHVFSLVCESRLPPGAAALPPGAASAAAMPPLALAR